MPKQPSRLKRAGAFAQKLYNKAPQVFKTVKRLEIFGPEKAAEYLNTYRKSFNHTDGTLKCTDLLKDYKENRAGFSRFKDVKGAGDEPMSKKLSSPDDEATQNIKQKLEGALTLDPKMNEAITEFETKVAEFNESCKTNPPESSPTEMASKIQELRSKLVKAIKEQQAEEVKNLKNLFATDEQLIGNLTAKMGTATPEEVEKLKSDMITTLEASHKEELKKVDDKLSAQVKNLHDFADKERRRVAYFAAMYNNKESGQMKAAIDNWHRKNHKSNSSGVEIISEADLASVKFKGLKFEDLELIQTITGRKITHAKSADGEDTFTIQFPRMGLYYYNSRHQQVIYDLTSIAQAVRAAGHDKVTMSVNYPQDKEYAMELGRKAYEAALKAGFPPNPKDPKQKNIAIKVNGELIEIDKLFDKNNEKLRLRREKAEKDVGVEKKQLEGAYKKADSWARQNDMQDTDNTVPQLPQNN